MLIKIITHIITSISTGPSRLTAILLIMSVLTLNMDYNLYVYMICQVYCHKTTVCMSKYVFIKEMKIKLKKNLVLYLRDQPFSLSYCFTYIIFIASFLSESLTIDKIFFSAETKLNFVKS